MEWDEIYNTLAYNAFTEWLDKLDDGNRIALFLGFGSIVIGVASAIAGAWFGSYSAFKLARKQQQQDQQDKRHSALIATQYALMSQWNLLEGIRQKYLEPNRTKDKRFVRMEMLHVGEKAVAVPFADITFIAESETANLLQEIHLAEQRYLSCLNGIAILRNELERFQNNPNLVHTGFNPATGMSLVEPARPGIDINRETFLLKEATDGLYEIFDKTLPATLDLIPELATFMLKEFPKRKALGFTPLKIVENAPVGK